MISFVEAAGLIPNDAPGATIDVRRIKEHEVPLGSVCADVRKVATPQLRSLEALTDAPQDALVREVCPDIAPIGHVEAASPVDAVEAVKARLVEEDEACRTLDLGKGLGRLGSNCVVVLGSVAVLAQHLEQSIHLVANHLVAKHQLGVGIAKHRRAWLQPQEEHAGANHRLEVPREAWRSASEELGQDALLATHPLDE